MNDRKPFEVVRLLTTGLSVKKVYCASLQKAYDLVWPNDDKQITRFVRAL